MDESVRDRQRSRGELLARLSPEDKISLLTGADYWSRPGHPGIGLRPIHTSDGPAGVRGPRWDERDTALNVPAPVALAVGQRALRELYLAPFESIVRQGRPWAVMAAYNSVNGHRMTESPMLNDILKGECAFDGVVVSSWSAQERRYPARRRDDPDLRVPPGQRHRTTSTVAGRVREGRNASRNRSAHRYRHPAPRPGSLETATGTWAIEPGDFHLHIGRSSRDARLPVTITIRSGTGLPGDTPGGSRC